MDRRLYDPCIFPNSPHSQSRITVDVPLTAGKITLFIR